MSKLLQPLLLLLAICCFSAVADIDYVFSPPSDKLTARQSSVYHITQDQHGFMWLATDSDGLLRFDGSESVNWLSVAESGLQRQNVNKFVLENNGAIWMASWGHGLTYLAAANDVQYNFRADSGDPDALASDRVQTLFLDSKQRLWIGTVAGVNYIDLANPREIKRYAAQELEHPLHKNRIWWITESAEGLWFATSDGIVLLNPEQQVKRYLLPQPEKNILERAREVRAIQHFSSGIWASSATGVYQYHSGCDCFARLEMPAQVASPRVNVLYQSPDNYLWVGSTEGLFLYDTEAKQWIKNRQGFNYLPDVDVRTLYENADSQLWVGSRDQGLFIGNPQQRAFQPLSIQLPSPLQQAASRLISALYQDQQRNIWIAAHGALIWLEHASNQWHQVLYRQQHNIRKIYQFASQPDGSLWLATDSGLYQMQDGRLRPELAPFELAGIPPGAITAFHISTDGDFYLGVWQRGLLRWQPQTQQATISLTNLATNSGDQIYQIVTDQSGNLYAATRYSGLYKRPVGQSWQPVETGVANLVEGFNCVLPVAETIVWLCSEYGLWRLDLQSGSSSQFLTEQGLPSVFITGAFLDQQQRLWALTNHGPARFNEHSQRFTSYSLNDGLPDLTMQRNAHLLLPDGSFLLGTAMGVANSKFDIEAEYMPVPRVALSQVEIDGRDQTRHYPVNQTQIALPANFRELVIGVSVLDYREPDKNTIRYRLLGFSSNWSSATRNRELRYLGLAPGNYLLEVIGQNSQGIQSAEPLRIQIQVAAPWWYSPYLWIVSAVVFLTTLLLSVYLRELNLRRRNARLAGLVSARTQELELLAQQLQNKADHDELTGLLNRAGFTEHFQRLRLQLQRSQQSLSLVLIDLDYFKSINDQFGHAAGDAALQHFAAKLSTRARGSDLTGRWGGEEFILALADCTASDAKVFCEALLREMQQEPCSYQGAILKLSATFGIAQLPVSCSSLEQWVKLADDALYQGKHRGRAQAVIAKPTQLLTN